MWLGLKRKITYFCVNRLFAGTKSGSWEIKRKMLNRIGHELGEGTKIVGPVTLYGTLRTGKDVWIGAGFTVHGLGSVTVGDRSDVAPNVTCLTGTHEIGAHERRAGEGRSADITVGRGCWIGANSTLIGGSAVGDGSVVAACACVSGTVGEDLLVGGVPAKTIRTLE